MPDNLQDHQIVKQNGYEVTFHPAFARRIVAQVKGEGENELYQQNKVHHLNGKAHPKKHQIRINGGKHGRNLALTVQDPNHSIARITVEFYGTDHVPGAGKETERIEVITLDNNTPTCPPHCE